MGKLFQREKIKRRFTFLNTFKNLTILLLTITAVLQAGKLWFEEIANRRLDFSGYTTTINEAVQPVDSGFAVPYRILTNIDENKFDVMYAPISSVQESDFKETVIKVFQEGNFEGEVSPVWQELVSKASYLCEYAFTMRSDIFAAAFTDKSGNFSRNVTHFDSVMIIPDIENRIAVYFHRKLDNKFYKYSISNPDLYQRITDDISTIARKNRKYYCVSSLQKDYNLFGDVVFIPTWAGDGMDYNIVNLNNPYLSKGQLLLNTVEKQVDIFFDKPASKWSGTANGAFTYSDENIVVKYYPTDILEYSDYRSHDKNNTSSFIADYRAAVNFIAKDKTVINDFYLADYTSEEGRSVFYFNYTVNNFPLVISNNIKSKAQITYPIEVVVEYEWVRKYKKLAYNYVPDKAITETVTMDYMGSLNMLVPQESISGIRLDNAQLGYNIDKSKQLTLYWFLGIEGKVYAQSTT